MIVDDMFEDAEFRVPYDRVREAGHDVVIVGLERDKVLTALHGAKITTERSIGEVDAGEFDALVIPGGYSPDKIRTDDGMVALVRQMFDAGKPVAAVCHAPWLLAEAGVARGRTVTSWPSIRTDLRNAGAKVVDREVVVDDNVITSRNPDDLPAFSDALLDQLK